MAKAAPAFQFYPNDFMTGTSRLTTADVGGYILLLCEQWHTGSVPGDDEQALALIMRCSRAHARAIWARIRSKFVRDASGVWMNARLEDERRKQDEYRAIQSERGKASADKRRQGNRRSTEPQPSPQPNGQPNGNSSSSVRTRTNDLDPPTSTPSGARAAPLVVGPLKFMQKAEKFAWYGSRLRVPHVLHDELRTKLGGTETDARLCHWYDQVNTECDVGGTPIVDVFVFLRPKFVEWASDAAADAELEKYRPKEATWTGAPGNGSTSGSARRTARPSTGNSAPPTTRP